MSKMASPEISPATENQLSTDMDDLCNSLQAEKENTQKKTFTSWVNSQLEKHSPPSAILDLYTDVGKGHVLLDLLEVLSGQQLPREKGCNPFQCRSNVENALSFLKNRSVKLINIHVADIIEGNPSIVLGLIWTIILHFHIEALAQTLACGDNRPSLDNANAVGSSPAASPSAERSVKAKERWKMSAKKALLLWAKELCATHESIIIADFKSSWRNGLAFLAVVHAMRPDLVDMEKAKVRSSRENLEEAFQIAEKELNIPRLLEPEDVNVINPDEKSIMTYVAQFLQYFKSLPVAEEETQGKVQETSSWLNTQEKKLTKLLMETEDAPFCKKFQEMLSFMETFNEEKKAFLPVLVSKRKEAELSEDSLRMQKVWDNLTSQMNEWKAQLDQSLPQPLDTLESWLQEIEQQLAKDVLDSQDHCKVMAALEDKRRAIQSLMGCSEERLETLRSFQNRDEMGLPLVPPQKLEEMRKRFSNIQLRDFSILVEYYHLFCAAILEELTSKLNIWHIKYGTKESVEALLSDWNGFIEEKGFLVQLETAFHACEEKKNKIINSADLGAVPQDTIKLFKMVDSKISTCKEYIYNVRATLQKILASWASYTENIRLLKAWLEERRKAHPKKIPTETLAAWNSRHGSLNEAGNFLIEASNEEVGSALCGELKKLNGRWAKLIKKTQFEMRLLGKQEEKMKLEAGSNGGVDSPAKVLPHQPADTSEEISFENVETLPSSSCAGSLGLTVSLSEQEVKANFEEAQKELEATVLRTMELLGQKMSPEGRVSKYEEAFSILDAKILGKFLKAAEQWKDVSPAPEKAVVEERSKDVCERWEAVRREIVSYIQLKMELEKGKLSKLFSKLNKQLNKEKKLINAGKTKGLIEEHEAVFSESGGLGELDRSLQILKTLSEKTAEEETQPKTKGWVAEYEGKKEDLQRRSLAIHRALASLPADGRASKKHGSSSSSANGEKASSLSSPDGVAAGKESGNVSDTSLDTEAKLQNGGRHAEMLVQDENLPLHRLKESCDAARNNLKRHLRTVRVSVASGFTEDVKDNSCFQNKLDELQALENEGDSSWKQFEVIASKLAAETGDCADTETSREELLQERNKLLIALNERMESLKSAWAFVLPIENEWAALCSLEKQLCRRSVRECMLTNCDLTDEQLKEIQASIVNCVEQCNRLEQGSPAGGRLDPVDRQAACVVAVKFKERCEELSDKVETVGRTLRELDAFLASLRCFKQSADNPEDASEPNLLAPHGERSKEEALREEAILLDEKLVRANISLEDADRGRMTCAAMLGPALHTTGSHADGFGGKQRAAQGSEAQSEFATRTSELFKNIQDIHDKIGKIGLRDPTIPAIQQRLKSLNELKQKLNRHVVEMKSLKEMTGQLLQSPEADEVVRRWAVMEGLWNETKLCIAERQEQCAQAIELLKQYHSFKNCLASIIQKQEHILSQQVSYLGKENLQRIMAKVEAAKKEFGSRSEDIDRINQISKNLQFQLNKMKSFEEPAFENEANVIVDRWLDINERTENYCDNLGRALALWDSLLNLSSSITLWTNSELKNVEDHHRPTEEALAELEAGLLYQEKNLEEFDRKVDEIQDLLKGSEPPLELQVIKSSLSNKMDLIRKHLPNKSIPAELNGNTAELKGDLDLAKTQIGMTESLLESLSPSNTLEIFTKLEELHQKILQQKHHVTLLQQKMGCLNPDVAELNEQLKSVTDLFNSKKQIFQDHFSTLLNYLCKDFNDWFSGTWLSLKECFDPLETKELLEEKLQQLRSFLAFEGKGDDIHEVKTLLNKVQNYLSKATVNQLRSWVRDQESELRGVTSKCQAREGELRASLQQFIRLEEDFSALAEWLRRQEEQWQDCQMKKPELEHFYRILLKQRETFDSLAWLANSLKQSGFSSDEVVLESSELVDSYEILLCHVRKNVDVSQALSVEENNFEELAHNMFLWVQRVKDSVAELMSAEAKMPIEERLCQIKEILLLKDEGDAKLRNVAALGERLMTDNREKVTAVREMVFDLQNQWKCAIHQATEYLRHQEQLQSQMEPDTRREEEGQAGHQTQELSLDHPPTSPDIQTRLTNYTELLQEAEGLRSLLNELESQRNSWGDGIEGTFAEELLRELEHLQDRLLRQLQKMAKRLEDDAEEQRHCEELVARLRATLRELSEPSSREEKQVQQDPLGQMEDTLQEIIALVESVKQKPSLLEWKFIEGGTDMPKYKLKKHFKNTVEYTEQEAGNIHNDVLKQNNGFSDEMQTQEHVGEIRQTDKPAITDFPIAAKSISLEEGLDEWQERLPMEESFGGKSQTATETTQPFQTRLTGEEQVMVSISTDSTEVTSPLAEGLKGNRMKSNNFQPSTSRSGRRVKKFRQAPADNHLADKPRQRQRGDQKQLPATGGRSEAPQTTLPLMNGKVMGANRLPSPATCPSPESKRFTVEGVSQTGLAPPEAQGLVEYAKMEQKVHEVKIEAADLDVALMNGQLGEIEHLCTQVEKQRASALLLWQGECSTTAQVSKPDLSDSHSLVSRWDQLLQGLMSVQEAKRHQLHLVNNYQGCLAAVQSSMKRLSVEKEHIKTRAPMEGTGLLENIQKCSASVQKERGLLNKLKTQQEHLSRHLKDADKELTRSQVEQAEQWWDQAERSLERKRLQVAAEASEFELLMSKARDLQRSLERQCHLRTGSNIPSGEADVEPALLTVELQALKDGIALLRRDAEMQMKRIWGDSEKGALENATSDLQNQVEQLEQLTPREGDQVTGGYPEAYGLRKRLEEAVLWVRVKALHLDGKVALFPDDVMSQIENCQAEIGEAKDQEPVLMGLADEAQSVISHLESGEASALRSLSSELQTGYRDLVPKLAQRLQQLESQLAKRQKLFVDFERAEAHLAEVEGTLASQTSEASTMSDLEQRQAVLEGIPEAIRETEDLIDKHLKDSPQGLNLFEQLFLEDCLRSLSNRTKRAYRLIQSGLCAVQRKIDACRKLSEKMDILQQELSVPKCDEFDSNPGELLNAAEEVRGKLHGFKERALDLQSQLSHLHRYKEVWECLGLRWDVPRLNELQSQLCKMAEGFAAECDGYQTPLNEVEAVTSSIQKDCEALDGSGSAPETGLMSAKILSHRVQQARDLTQEELSLLDKNETLGASLKEAKRQHLKNLEVKIDGLARVIQSQRSALEDKSIPEQDLQSRLDHNLQTWKEIRHELQQPLWVDLETHLILREKMHCKALEGFIEAEFCAAEELMNQERGAAEEKSLHGLRTKLDELENLKVQLKADIATRLSALEEAYGTVKSYSTAVQKAADLARKHESLLACPLLSLSELEESCLLVHRTQEEFEAARAEVEAQTSHLRGLIKPNLKPQLEKTLCELLAKSLAIKEQNLKRNSDVQRCFEKYCSSTKSKEKIRADLHDVEKILGKSFYHIPGSYKEALEQSEQSKTLASRLVSAEEDLMNLRQDLGYLSSMCKENDRLLIATVVSALWLKWLSLLKAARELENRCEEQRQEWKSVSEEIERETIILDNLQEDLPENLKEKERFTKEELQAFLECANSYEDSVNAEELFLRLIRHRASRILNIPQDPAEQGEGIPVVREIQLMRDRLKELQQKAQKRKDVARSEVQDRAQASDEIDAVKNSLQDTMVLLHGLDLEALPERTAKLEEIQRAIESQKQTFEQIMDGLRIKYSEMYTIVPAEIEKHVEDCSQILQEIEEKVSTEVLKNSPHYTTDKKIEDINKGLQAVENMLQQKSADVTKAKDIQKRIWDLLDLWHYKMNELDSEVQDIVEQDPCQGQELMDRLMIPLQQYQQVSQLAERRTTQINRAASKMEASDELVKSTRAWLESTSRLLTEEAKSDSAKELNKHASALQMALEDSEQKQNTLRAMYPELDELSALIETDSTVKQLCQVNEQVAALQQQIVGILPLIQHLADEVEAIESEVKTMEKDVDKIRTILSPSDDSLEFSPKEHLKHGQVILGHIGRMKKTLTEIQSYQAALRLPGVKLQPFSVFQRTKRLLKDLKALERTTKEQEELLEPIVNETERTEQEIDSLKLLLKSHLDDLSAEIPLAVQAASHPEGEETEEIKRQIVLLCQRKEDLLMTMKNSLLELHQRQEEPELEDECVESQALVDSALVSGGGMDRQLSKRGSLSLLPSLVEEAEDNSFHNEGESSSTPPTNGAECLVATFGELTGTVDAGRPAASEPAHLLQVCQAKVAELEGWLVKVKASLESVSPTCQMQQAVERHLAACQAMLSEIEQKVGSLLEDCKDRHTDERADLQQEAESLSLKLKDVKSDLEKVHGMLREKYTEEQLVPVENTSEESSKPFYFDFSSTFPPTVSERPLFSRSSGLQQEQELLLKLAEQKKFVDFLEVYVEIMQLPSADVPILETSSHDAAALGNGPPALIPKDPVGDKWQYLEEELLFKMKPPHYPFNEPQIATKINILPKGAASSVKTPTIEELKMFATQLGNLSQEASIPSQETTMREVPLNLDQKLFELLLAISRCLNNMEQMLSTCGLTSEEALEQQELYETLSVELQKLHADIGDKKDDLLKSITSAGGSPDRFSQCFSNLQARLQLTQEATASRGKSVKAELDHYSNFQNEIRLLYDALMEKKSALQQSFRVMSGDGVSKQLQKINSQELEELQNFEKQTAKLQDHAERLNLPVDPIHDVYKLKDVLDDLWRMLRSKQRELTSPFISEQQYDALLRGLAELVALGQDKVTQAMKLKTFNQPNLQLQLRDHKNFFCKLNAHMLLAEMCSKRMAPSLFQEREKFWKELVEEIKHLDRQAVQHGARLQRLLQDWIEFDEAYTSFSKKLEALLTSVPSVTLVEETEERLMERSGLLQQLKRSIEEEQSRYHQILKEGRKLMELVSCPELDSQVGKLEDQWISLSQKVGDELQRLETLFKLLSSYNRDSKELEAWLESAQQRVNFWKEQSLNASQDLNTVTNSIYSLLAFLKEVDDKSSLKSSVIGTGNQLLLLKESEAAMIRSIVAEFERKWADLITQLPSIQEKFHQLLVAKLPSNEAITELIAWMNHIDQERCNEACVNSQSTACQVKDLLQKYRGYLIEMNFKQWIVDYVNQSLLQMTTGNVESKRHERTVFAERLGEMNLQWHRLQGALNRKIKEVEHILEIVTENENRSQSLGSWLDAQNGRLKLLEKPLSFIHAQNAAGECQALENQLAAKSDDMDQLKQALGDCAELPEAVVSRINELDRQRTRVVNQVAVLKASTKTALEEWRLYDDAWDDAGFVLARAFYCAELSKPPVITLETLKHQVGNLQSLQDQAEGNEEVWTRLRTAGDNLKKLCDPSCSDLIDQKYKKVHTRWVLISEDTADQLQKARASLHLWESYAGLHAEVTAKLDKHQEQCASLLAATVPASGTRDFLRQKSQDIEKLQLGLQNVKASFHQAPELAEKIAQATEPAVQAFLPEKLQPLQRISYLEQMLQMKADEFQCTHSQLEDFENRLKQLEHRVKGTTEALANPDQGDEDSDLLLSQMLDLAALSPEMERLNEVSFRLPLGDFTAKRLQSLNWEWAQKRAMALEQCSKLQDVQSEDEFLLRCQRWVLFFEKMKERLKENVAGTLEELEKQQRDYEVTQAEISVHQPIFNSMVSKALHVVESGEAQNRAEFISKLTQLKEQWQGAVQAAQRRKSEIDGLVKRWHKFNNLLRDLTKFLKETQSFLAAVKSQDKYSLHQVQNLCHDFQYKQVLLWRWQTRCSLALDTGEELRDAADPEVKAVIQKESSQLQESWSNAQLQVEEIMKQLQGHLQTFESSERQTEGLHQRLQELKTRVKEPLPAEHDELQKAKEHMKELEKSLASWNRSLKELGTMKADLAHRLFSEDVMVLREQVELLHTQWEELCLRVSLRKQEIEDRLNAWMVFSEKNKELCAWLVQMESKVLQSADISIEDMIDKLQKDCMEEINQFSENKLIPLKRMGSQLIKASNKSQVAEIDEKLNKINHHWQHLFDVIGGRVKKLKETFAFIQQLDKNMSNLRTWLARIESELSKPVIYDICDNQEIQKRLAEQQDLQRDIEQHSAGVESVFNICEVLLHDSDACANETECDSIQQTTRSLDRRWRNICAMSMERRMKIEETWRLWQKFLEDYSRFEDWLKTAERTAACPNSSEVAYTNAKEELKKFEAFQRQIHERLTQLELINKQYRRLARENRTDSASKLKQMVYEGNQQWDNLQKRVAAILRRLKHFTNQWEEFVGMKDSILVWLTEMDLQLTNVEHFSEGNFDDKMRQLNGFQQEITLNINKIDQLIVFGEHLIQKSEPSDAVVIEEELEELHKYCQEVFGRVSRFHQKLMSWHPRVDDEKEASENEADAEDSQGMQTDLWRKKATQEVPPSPQSLCHLIPPAVGQERSGCETPVSVDSIPLEWDHTGDVGGSSSQDEEEEPYYSALSAGKSASEPHPWHSPDGSTCRKHPYNQGEMVRNVLPNSPETSTPYKPSYVKQLSSSSVDSTKEMSGILPSEESPNSQGHIGVPTVEKQSGGIERWELLQAQDLSNKLRMKQNLQQWQQLNSDLANINAWLDQTEEELEVLQEAGPVTSMQTVKQRVKKLKEMLKAFDNYKALVLSVNLTSRDFKQADSTESKELQNRLRRVNLRWEKANHLLGVWRKGLQESLMRCQDFYELNQKLLLWLAGAETQWHRARVKDPNADPHVIQESRKELMQLEKELLERQLQVHTLQEISTYLLAQSDDGEYVDANEKVHVIGKKLKQLLQGVSQDLKTARSSQDISAFLPGMDELDSRGAHQEPEITCMYKNKVDGRKILGGRSDAKVEERGVASPPAPKTPSFFYRLLRAALPLQLLFLLLLLLAFMIPYSEEDYSCTRANNFARSFYPMLRYTKGPPPT